MVSELFDRSFFELMADAPFLQVLDACYPPLGVCDHLREEIREACAAELCISASV